MAEWFSRAVRSAILSLRKPRMWVFIALIILLATAPYYASLYIINVLLLVTMFLGLAESYDILGGYAGYMNLGHGSFWGIGAYAFALAFLGSFSLPLSMLIAGLFAAFFAFIIAFPMFRLKGAYFAITGLAVVLLLQYVVINLRDVTGGSSGISIPLTATLIPAYYVTFPIAVATVVIHYVISKTKFGLALISIKEAEDVAEIFGINVFKVKLQALVIGGFLAGLLGGAYMYYITYIYPMTVFSLENTIAPVIMAMLGGTGIWHGPVIGSIILMLIQEYLWTQFAYFHLLIYGLLMLIVGLLMPGGIVRSRFFTRRPPIQAPVKVRWTVKNHGTS